MGGKFTKEAFGFRADLTVTYRVRARGYLLIV